MKLYTTGDVAELCQVTPRTVCKWFDVGLIEGFCLPLSGDRRISRDSLVRFMKKHNFPTDELEQLDGDNSGERQPGNRALIVSDDQVLVDELRHELSKRGWIVDAVANVFDAGASVESLRPAVVVVDLEIGVSIVNNMLRSMSESEKFSDVRRIVIFPERSVRGFVRSLADDCFYKPITAATARLPVCRPLVCEGGQEA